MIRRLAALCFVSTLAACAADGEGRLDYAADAQKNYEKGLAELEDERWLDAIRFFEHVRSKFPYSTYASAAELKTADANFSREKFTEAIDGYGNFVRFHPAHPNVDWAAFRVGESHVEAMPSDFFLLPSDTEKDQTQIRAARTALEEFLRKYPKSEHRPRAEDRMSPDGRAVLDRLEQEAWRGALVRQDKPPVRKHRRKLVAHKTPRQDDERRLGALRIERRSEVTNAVTLRRSCGRWVLSILRHAGKVADRPGSKRGPRSTTRRTPEASTIAAR